MPSIRTILAALTMALAATIAIAACGGEDEAADTTTSTSAITTSSIAATTSDTPTSETTTSETTTSETTPTTSTSTPPDDVSYEVDNPVAVPPPIGGTDANGSGCNPGDGDLPDGIWFGILQKLTDDAVEFDLACWFTGEAANRAAEEDGETEIPVPNDFYIRNQSPVLRTLPVSSDALVHALRPEPSEGTEILFWGEFVDDPSGYIPCPGSACLAWLYVNDGQVTAAVTQYTP